MMTLLLFYKDKELMKESDKVRRRLKKETLKADKTHSEIEETEERSVKGGQDSGGVTKRRLRVKVTENHHVTCLELFCFCFDYCLTSR